MISKSFFRNTCMAVGLAFAFVSTSQAQRIGLPSSAPAFNQNTGDASAYPGGILAHIQQGSAGNLAPGNSWIGLGKPVAINVGASLWIARSGRCPIGNILPG